MKHGLVGILLTVATTHMVIATDSRVDLSRVVVIKADDFREKNRAWTDFLEASRAADVKVSFGAIAESIHENSPDQAWMREQEKRGDVEFWNHGWDHKQWTTDGQTLSEFQGSGFEHQRDHLARSQAVLRSVLGRKCTALGTPFNGIDNDTAAAINNTPELRLFFSYPDVLAKRLTGITLHLTVLPIIGESDGTGKPNAEKLAATLEARPRGPVALQFHPPYFDAVHLDEYKKILVYLKAHGYMILLPSELVAAQSAAN